MFHVKHFSGGEGGGEEAEREEDGEACEVGGGGEERGMKTVRRDRGGVGAYGNGGESGEAKLRNGGGNTAKWGGWDEMQKKEARPLRGCGQLWARNTGKGGMTDGGRTVEVTVGGVGARGKTVRKRKSRSPERTGKGVSGFTREAELCRSIAGKSGVLKRVKARRARCASRAFVDQNPQLRAFVRLDPARLNFDPREADDVHRVLDRVIEQADVLEHEAALAVRFILGDILQCESEFILPEHRFDKLLGRGDVHLAAHGKRDRVKAAFGIGEAKERARVALGEGIFRDELSLGVAQAEKAKLIRHARLTARQDSRDFALCHAVIGGKREYRRRFLEHIEVGALYVFDCRKVCRSAAVDLAHDARHLGKSGNRCRAEAALSCDKLVFAEAVGAAHRQRLNDPVLRDRVGECGERGGLEGHARLRGIRADGGYLYAFDAAQGRIGGRCGRRRRKLKLHGFGFDEVFSAHFRVRPFVLSRGEGMCAVF